MTMRAHMDAKQANSGKFIHTPTDPRQSYMGGFAAQSARPQRAASFGARAGGFGGFGGGAGFQGFPRPMRQQRSMMRG